MKGTLNKTYIRRLLFRIQIPSLKSTYSVLEKKIKEEDKLIDLGINSIDYIKFVLVLESEFGFEFDDEALDMNNISNVRLLYQYICKKLSKD